MTAPKNDTSRRRRASLSKGPIKRRLVRTQIQLDERQAERLKAVAASRGLSMAEWIRRAVGTALLSGGFTDKEEQRRRAIAASGQFDSGATDISAEHDKYLAEAFGDHLPSVERKSNKPKDQPPPSQNKVSST